MEQQDTLQLQQKQAQEKFIRMTQTPIPKLVSRLAVPTIISMLVTSFYNMADTFFVGRINTSATAAVGVVFSLMAVIQALGFTFGHGSGNFISRKLGSRDFETAERMAATGFVSAFLAGGILTVVGLLFLQPLVFMLGATETIAPYAADYARFILIGAPWMTASLVLNNQLRFQGSAFYGMIGITSGAVLNIALDPIFIFVLDMGIGGASLATILSQLVSFFLLLAGCRRGGNLPLRLKNVSFKLYFYKEILRGGLPSFFRQSIASVATICMNLAAGGWGDAAIAAMSIVNRVTMFANSALIGFGQGFQPVCGFNYGAKFYGRVREAFWFCLKVAVGALVLLSAVGFLFAPQIIAIFRRTDPDVIAIGTLALRCQCLTFPLFSWVVLDNMMLQTIGKALPASILALARQGIFFLPALALLVPALGLLGVQIALPVSDICTFLLSLPIGMHTLRQMARQELAEAANRSSPPPSI
ncbi:MAG: MATE family efflux transporter [Pygmaiobacter massiliensis]|nr:MATE family efflux transporter [Pygmaiobacter massiliensis]